MQSKCHVYLSFKCYSRKIECLLYVRLVPYIYFIHGENKMVKNVIELITKLDKMIYFIFLWEN